MSDAIPTLLGRIPSGLFILTARSSQGEETGMLASWVQQASFDPPAITVGVNSKRYLKDWLTPGATVALSQLSDKQKSMLGHFGKGFEPGEPAFEGISVEQTPAGFTVLSDSIGWIEGTVAGSFEAGEHTLFLVQLTAAAIGPRHAEETPWVHLRKNGLKY
ncbi:MAG TPA: flavin reductase family protein [Planctomicrobium sp.]|nr:flavin reductase family protein [Planctomicrobium sp.]